jgi:hypothetical protein
MVLLTIECYDEWIKHVPTIPCYPALEGGNNGDNTYTHRCRSRVVVMQLEEEYKKY